MTQPGYIYLMRFDENTDPLMCAYKIGKSINPDTRNAQIGIVMPYDLTITHIVPTSDMTWAEDYIHWVFYTWHLRGEWFGGINQEQLDWFCSLTQIEQGSMIDPPWYIHPRNIYIQLRRLR